MTCSHSTRSDARGERCSLCAGSTAIAVAPHVDRELARTAERLHLRKQKRAISRAALDKMHASMIQNGIESRREGIVGPMLDAEAGDGEIVRALGLPADYATKVICSVRNSRRLA